MAIIDFSVNNISFWAVINGVEIELTRVEFHYALNAIPSAVLHCAIGRDVETLEPAPIHDIIDQLSINTPITVLCEADEVANSGVQGSNFPAGTFTIFDGKITGTAFQKSRNGSASFVLNCRNFLMDLEYALTNTRNTHAKNIGALNAEAGVRNQGGGANFTIQTMARKYFTQANITDDFWTEALQPWLHEVIELPAIFEGEDISEGQGATDALDALDLINSDVPLAMVNFNVLQYKSAVNAIAADAAQETLKSFYGTTIWEKIVADFASRYLFALVPLAERALIVPFIPGLEATWVSIDPSEYETLSLSGELPRALRGVVVFTGGGSMTGALGFQQGQAGANGGVGGEYENEDIEDGMFHFVDGPAWLVSAVNPDAFAKGAAIGVKGNAMNPGVGAAAADQPGQIRADAVDMWDAYAQAVYLYEVLKNRRGTISGKMRFDIAPGSSVQLITSEEPFVGGEQFLYGMVTRVSIIYDADAAQGCTNIEIGFLRDAIENQGALSTTTHPLWQEPWPGAALVEQ